MKHFLNFDIKYWGESIVREIIGNKHIMIIDRFRDFGIKSMANVVFYL